MFTFGKKKRYSIGEKIKYFKAVAKNPAESQRRKQWAQRRLAALNKTKADMKLGDVFIVNDKIMGAPKKKPRAVVVAKTQANRAKVLPVKKENKIMSLSQFDGKRRLSMGEVKEIDKGYLYEPRGFKLSNLRLTPKEKDKLYGKVEKYIK